MQILTIHISCKAAYNTIGHQAATVFPAYKTFTPDGVLLAQKIELLLH